MDLVFKSQTQQLDQVVNKIQKFERDIGKLKGQNPFEGTERGARGAGNAVERAGNQAKTAAGGFDRLGGALRGLISAYAVIQAGKFVLFKTAELETQTRSLQVLTGSLKEAQSVISELQSFAAVTPFTSTELIETAKRLKAFGVDTEKLVETTKRLGDVAGATGAELSGIATAYGQIQAKGRLQGEELLQLQERGIGLQGELQKMYQLTGDEFREALEKGRISAEAVELAIKNLTDAGGQYANGAIAQSDTLNGKFSTLQDAIDQTARLIGATLTPAINAVISQAIQAINTINNLLAAGARAQKFGLNQQARTGILRQAQGEAEQIVNTRRIKDPFERNRVFQEIASQREKDLIEAYGYKTGQIQAEVKAPTISAGAPPPLLSGTGGGGGSKGSKAGGGKKGAGATRDSRAPELEAELVLKQRLFALEQQIQAAQLTGDKVKEQALQQEIIKEETAGKIAQIALDSIPTDEKKLKVRIAEVQEAEKLAELQFRVDKAEQDRQKTLEERLTSFDREIELAGLKTEEAKKLQQIEYDILDLRKQGLLLTEDEIAKYRERAQAAAQTGGGGSKIQDYINKLKTELGDTEGQIVSLAGTVESELGSAMSNAITGLIDGTQTAEEAFSQMFKNIGAAFIDMATQMIAQALIMKVLGIFAGGAGGGGGFGSVDSNGFSFGSLVNAFASGGSTPTNTPVLVGERGPELFVPGQSGGITNNQNLRSMMDSSGAKQNESSNAVTNLSFETVQIMDQQWIDRPQLEAAMAAASKRGAADGERRALDKLKQSPSTRRSLGL